MYIHVQWVTGKVESRYTIRLHTTVPEAPWKPVKLVPDRNNLRPQRSLCQLPPDLRSLVTGSHDCELRSYDESEGTDLPPTPHYNSLVLSDMGGMERHLSDVYAAQQECPAVADAVVLFRVWARQRGISQGYGGFTGFHFSLLLALLLTQRKISPLMSSYQILKVALQAIASSDWSTSGVSMAAPDPSLPSLSSFHSHHSVVFLDSSGLLNLLSHLSLSRHLWLRHEAAVSLTFLDDTPTDGFAALFMTPVSFELKFDLLLHISPVSVLHSYLTRDANEGTPLLLNGGCWPLPLIMEKLLPILNKGLGKRVKLLTFRPFQSTQWLVSKEPVLPCDSHVTVGVVLDSDHAFSVLDMGPAADSKQAGEFRVFWGERSELRRFQDGSINEAVVWKGGSVGERQGVVTQIIAHLLHRHVGVPVESVTSSAGALSPLLSLPLYSNNCDRDTSTSQHSLTPLATGEEEGKKIEDVFGELSKQLRGLKGLPLAITSIQGASPEFRHCSVFPPLAWNGRTPRKTLAEPGPENQSDCLYPSCDSATPPFIPALEVVLQLEGSGKWPSELSAISSVKTAFYTYLSQTLSDQGQLLCSPTKHHLDVLKSGYVFRLRIHYPRELSILRETISAAQSHEVSGLRKTLAAMQRQLVDRPLLTSILHGLSLQHSAFGAGARLCKRWIAAHLMTNHLGDEAIELMVAHLFLQPHPFTQPCSPETVLLRFLFLLSTHEWETEPLIVNLNNELSVSEMADIRSMFTSQRSQLPPCFIATPLHRDSSPLTSPSPSFPVFHRLCLLAKESLGVLSSQLISPDLPTADIKQVFRTPLTGYNVLIHLTKKHVPLAALAVDVAVETGSTHTRNSSQKDPTHFPVTDFNPVEKYLAELERAFSEFCLFFYDKYGGRCIAVVWRPQAFPPQPFKVMQAFCKTKAVPGKGSKKKKSECLFVPDVEAILADFQLMGQGLVTSLEILSEPPVLCS
jgi:U3 small nucleolar RNA-associated protein 22